MYEELVGHVQSSASALPRVHNFRSHILLHPKLVRTRDTITELLGAPSPPLITVITGPAGVGKTTLLRLLDSQLIHQSLPRMSVAPGELPTAHLTLVPSLDGQFSWYQYDRQVLQALQEPLIDYKIDPHSLSGSRRRSPQARSTPEALLASLQLCIAHRKPRAILVDGAHLFTRAADGVLLKERATELANRVTMTGTPHILVATYDVLEFVAILRQAEPSISIQHFEPYYYDREQDRVAWRSILAAFQPVLPLDQVLDLAEQSEYLYEGSTGCVGELCEWLDGAVAIAREGTGVITMDALTAARRQAPQLLQLARELNAGTEAFARITGKSKHRALKGQANNRSDKAKPKALKRRPGERNPKRDKVGK